jgi:two-component system, NtrC family, nitrogen regulation response regulator NtrX
MDGVELLKTLKATEPGLEIVMLTGHASIDTAINSMRMGAYDFLTVPGRILGPFPRK